MTNTPTTSTSPSKGFKVTVDKQTIKMLVAIVTSIIASIGGVQALGTRGNHGISKAAVQHMIDVGSQYSRDRSYIYSQLNTNRIQLAQIQSDLASLRVSEVRVETKIDLLRQGQVTLIRRKGH